MKLYVLMILETLSERVFDRSFTAGGTDMADILLLLYRFISRQVNVYVVLFAQKLLSKLADQFRVIKLVLPFGSSYSVVLDALLKDC